MYVSQNRGKAWYAVGSENGGLLATHISSLVCTTSQLIVGTDNGIIVENLDGMAMSHVSLKRVILVITIYV
jgi:ligand-binding sensor domain-containing protein